MTDARNATMLADIAKARETIEYPHDGPVTTFVLLARAVEIGTTAAANALAEALTARGIVAEIDWNLVG